MRTPEKLLLQTVNNPAPQGSGQPLIETRIDEYLGPKTEADYKTKLDRLGALLKEKRKSAPNRALSSFFTSIVGSSKLVIDVSLATLGSSLADATIQKAACRHYIELRVALSRDSNQQTYIPIDVLRDNILPLLDFPSAVAVSQTCHNFRAASGDVINMRLRLALAGFITQNSPQRVSNLLTSYPYFPNSPYRGSFCKLSPFYAAARARNTKMYELLIGGPLENNPVLHLQYLVISGLENEVALRQREQFQAETLLRRCGPGLIFTKGPDRLSALQMAAKTKDVHMLLALLRPLVTNPSEVAKIHETVMNSDNLTPKEKFEECCRALIDDLCEEYRTILSEQLQELKPEPCLTEILKLCAEGDEHYRNEQWSAFWKVFEEIHKLLGSMMPLHFLADTFFHSLGQNNQSFYEASGARACIDRLGDTVFSYLGSLGSSRFLLRPHHNWGSFAWYRPEAAMGNNDRLAISGGLQNGFETVAWFGPDIPHSNFASLASDIEVRTEQMAIFNELVLAPSQAPALRGK